MVKKKSETCKRVEGGEREDNELRFCTCV